MKNLKSAKGFTMTELVVAAVLISVAVYAGLKTFRGIAQSVFMSQTKQVATSLAREKLEALQVLPYYRLRAQGGPSLYQPGGAGKPFFYYDGYYTPGPERVQVGTVVYYRGAYVDRVYRDPSTENLVAMAVGTPYQTEAGLKRIKVAVMWKDGSTWKVVDVTGLKENPVRTRGEVRFVGTITSTDGIPLSGAIDGIRVETIETLNQMIAVQPNMAGFYDFSVRPGTYTIRVRDARSTPYYYTVKQTAYVGYDTAVTTVNFQMPRIQEGRVHATFWWNSNPVISRVVGSSVSFVDPNSQQEWVEIFNPTTWTWDATRLNLHFYMNHNSSEPSPGGLPNTTADYRKHKIEVNYINTTIPPGGYFLFANTTTIRLREGAVDADAVWEGVNPSSNVWFRVDNPSGPVGRFDPTGIYYAGYPNLDILTTAQTGSYLMSQTTWVWTSTFTGYYPVQYNGGGGYLRLTYSQFSSTDYIYLDGVGWRGGVDTGGGITRDPVSSEEGYRLIDKTLGGVEDLEGFHPGEQFIRYASTMAWQETRDIGPAYDTNCNVRDWSKWDPAAPGYFARFAPRNSTCPTVPVVSGRDMYARSNRLGAGNEAGYVNAFVNDGLSTNADPLRAVYFTGWTPSGTGFCTTCPRSNLFPYAGNSDIPWWGRFEFNRVATGTWTLGMYVRRDTGGSGTGGTAGQQPYHYHASTQILVNVTPGSYEWWRGPVQSTTNRVYFFGTVSDVYGVPIEGLRVDYRLGGATPVYVQTRVGGAYNVDEASSTDRASTGLYHNQTGTAEYLSAYTSYAWGLHEFWAGEGYYVPVNLGYTGYLTGHVRDDIGQPIPEVMVSAINAATMEERASGLTNTSGNFSINVATGLYKVRALTELEETVSPAISSLIDLSTTAAGGVFVGTFTISNAYGRRSGSVIANGQPVQTGVVLVLTTTTIAGSTPSLVNSVFRAGNVKYYMAASDAMGRYTFDVKSDTYNLYGFYPYFTSTGTFTWVKRTTSSFVNSGNNATDFPTLDVTP